MRYQTVCESHCHSDHSRDGFDPILSLYQRAEELGLRTLSITDHCEINAYLSEAYRDSAIVSHQDIRTLAAEKKQGPELLAGVEIGQAMQQVRYANELLDRCDYDFVLASVHNVRNEADFFELDYSAVDVDHFLRLYFNELEEVIAWGRFDSLAHLTYPLRYITGEHHIPVDLDKYAPQIDSILSGLVRTGKALEVNTSGLRQQIGKTLPHLEIVKRFHDLGGAFVTVGSDAHCAADLAKGIEEGYDLLLEAGFQEVTVYRRHIPEKIPLKRIVRAVTSD